MIDKPIATAQALGDVVRAARQSRDLSQADLAELAGVGRKWVLELEHGNSGARLDHVLSVIEVLGLELSARTAGVRSVQTRDLDEILGIQ